MSGESCLGKKKQAKGGFVVQAMNIDPFYNIFRRCLPGLQDFHAMKIFNVRWNLLLGEDENLCGPNFDADFSATL